MKRKVSRINFHAGLPEKMERHDMQPLQPITSSLNGYLGSRYRRTADHCMATLEQHGAFMLDTFARRGGQREEPWDGEYIGKWLDAAARFGKQGGPAALLSLACDTADRLLAFQDADGYLGIEPSGKRGGANGTDWDWDIWNQWYVLTGLITLSEQADEVRFLDAAHRIGRWIVDHYGPIEDSNARFFKSAHGGGCNVDVVGQLVRLAGMTGDTELQRFAARAIELYPPCELMRRCGRAPHMHAYVLLACLGGVVEYAMAESDRRELDWVERVWEDLNENHLYPTGGIGFEEMLSDEAPNDLAPNRGDRSHQETCATVEWMIFNDRLLRATGRARYADALEQSIYNALLGAQSIEGKQWMYYTPLRYAKHWFTGPTRCCYWSGPRGIAMISDLIAYRSGTHVFISQFERSTVVGHGVKLMIDSNYPMPGQIQLQLQCEDESIASVHIRVPCWCTHRFSDRDDTTDNAAAKGWATIRPHELNPCAFNLRMPPRRVSCANIGDVVCRGPVVLAAEEQDNPHADVDAGPSPGPPLSASDRPDGTIQVSWEGPSVLSFRPYAEAGQNERRFRTAWPCQQETD